MQQDFGSYHSGVMPSSGHWDVVAPSLWQYNEKQEISAYSILNLLPPVSHD